MPEPLCSIQAVAASSMACSVMLADAWKTLLKWSKSNLFLIYVMLGAAFGAVAGAVIGGYSPSDTTLLLIGFPGEIFMRVFKLLILPLVIASITTASANLNAKTNGKMAAVTFTYFILSSMASATIGLIMVLAVHPGKSENGVDELIVQPKQGQSQLLDTILDLIRNMLPENIIQACLQQVQTIYTPRELQHAISYNVTSNGTASDVLLNDTFVATKRVMMYRNQANFLGLIVCFFIFGTFLGIIGEKGKPLVHIFNTLDDVILMIITKFTWFTPVGVASLICERVASVQLDLLAAQLGVYTITVLSVLCIHIFIFIPVVYALLVRKNPVQLLSASFETLFATFATDSSAIALPMTLHCMEEKLRIDKRVTRFVLPLGVTINMNGTASFLALASVFLAQMNGIEPSLEEQLSVIFCATLVSIAAVAVPSASLFLLGIVVSVIPGVPTEDIALLFAVDWILSRCRGICNVLGDCCGAAIVEKICKQDLMKDATEAADLTNSEILGRHPKDEVDKEALQRLTICK